jgi:hypothetical protein
VFASSWPPAELQIASYVVYARRTDPAVSLEEAPIRSTKESVEKLRETSLAFCISCIAERFRLAGMVKNLSLGDPFSLTSKNRCALSEGAARFLNSKPSGGRRKGISSS